MCLDLWFEKNPIKTYTGGKPKFSNSFNYWRRFYIEKCKMLFTIDGLPFKQKEVDIPLILFGRCGVNYSKRADALIAAPINLHGITSYVDEFTHYDWNTPLDNGTCKIGVDGVLVENDSLRNPLIALCDRYAMLSAHTDITFINSLVNGRSSKTIVAGDNKAQEEARKYQNKLYNGNNDVIVDRAFLGLEFHDNDTTSLGYLKPLYDTRQAILYSFYEDLGIKKNQQKRERLVTDEVNADDQLLKLNVKDMLESRQRACDEINKLFGLKLTVKCNVDYDDNGVIDSEETKEGAENET